MNERMDGCIDSLGEEMLSGVSKQTLVGWLGDTFISWNRRNLPPSYINVTISPRLKELLVEDVNR